MYAAQFYLLCQVTGDLPPGSNLTQGRRLGLAAVNGIRAAGMEIAAGG